MSIEQEGREAAALGLGVELHGRQTERRATRHHDARLIGAVQVIIRNYDREVEYSRTRHETGLDLAIREQLAALAGLFGVRVADQDWVEQLRREVSR